MSTPTFRAPSSTFGNYPGAVLYPTLVETYSPSAAGNSAVAAVASARVAKPHTVVLVTPAAGAGAYTYTLSLSITNHVAGDIIEAKYTAPASTNPTIEFHNATAGGTLLLTCNPAASFVGNAKFVYSGTAWVLLGAGSINSTLGSVTTGAGSFTTLAASSTLAVTGASTLTGAVSAGSTLAVTGAITGPSLAATGAVTSSSTTAKVGYATGAGAAATQATSKSTTVTNTASAPSTCGTITMHNAALNAGVIVSFTFTNSAIAATDVLILNHVSGGTIGSYTLNAQAAAGSATVNVRNNTAGNLSEAIVIQYAVVKAVAS